jgi:hypothetical protein
MKTPNEIPKRANEGEELMFIPSLRARLNAVTLEVLEAIEEEGPVLDNGDPSPLLCTLTDLIRAGGDLRRLSVARRFLELDEKRAAK